MLGFSGKSFCGPQFTEIASFLSFFLCLNRKFEVKLIVIISETNIGRRKTDL